MIKQLFNGTIRFGGITFNGYDTQRNDEPNAKCTMPNAQPQIMVNSMEALFL